MPRFFAILMLIFTVGVITPQPKIARAASDNRYYPIGTPTLQSIWVDPVAGDDQQSGASRATAKRTFNAAWALIPADTDFTTGYQILLTPGTYVTADIPASWSNRHGTAQFPIVVTASDGADTATISSTLTLSDVDYLYLTNVTVAPSSGGPAIHCSRCSYFLLKNMTIVAAPDSVDTPSVSVDQSHHIYLENSDISGAVSYTAVHYGNLYGNQIHDASGTCLITGTGSALLSIEANRITRCGGVGYMAGLNSGFDAMQSPWIHYDAYDIKFANNIVTTTQAAGMAVSAGYNVLLANNTLYRVGVTSAPIAVQLGTRLCASDILTCGANLAQRGWGTTKQSGSGEFIPNRNVFIYNNIVVNPADAPSPQHVRIDAPKSTVSVSHIPQPSRADDNLRISGNIWWNGAVDLPLGIGGSQGCADTNLTCNNTLVRANNRINTLQPEFNDLGTADFHPRGSGTLTGITSVAIPDFSDNRYAPPQAPLGDLRNRITRDIANTLRQSDAPGAYAATIDNPTITPQPDIASVTPTATPARNTYTASLTRKPSFTPSITRSPTQTFTPSITRSPSQTFTPSISRSPTQTFTPSISRSPSQTFTPSITRSPTQTFTPSITRSLTRTKTPSISRSLTRTKTPSISRSLTKTYTPSPTRTPTATATNTRTASITITATPIEAVPIIPRIDATTKATLMHIHRRGLDLGNFENTFAKAGDSISASDFFLVDIGCGGENLADYKSLQTTVTYFRNRQFATRYGTGWCRASNSFNAESPSAQSGWSAPYALNSNWLYPQYQTICPYQYYTPITCEFGITNPSIVFIMFGTNDTSHGHTSDFRFALTELVKISIDNGIIPVLSTIPPRTDNSVAGGNIRMFNTIIIEVARNYHIPLWNYWLALQSPQMIHFGISSDNVHPNVYKGTQSADFSREGLRYGYNQRNLEALQILDSIRRIIFENGPPDAP